jgi:glycine betaine/proline transport system ATP-binding protein
MNPQAYRISANTIQEAISQMKGIKQDYAYHVTDEGYQGVLTKEGLNDAAKATTEEAISEEIYEEVPSVSPDAAIEEVLVDTMSYDYSLPVVDEDGNLQGELERRAVAEIFSEPSDEEPADSPKLDKAS